MLRLIYLPDNSEITEKDKNGRTALHLASKEGNIEKVLELLDKGADINAEDNNKSQALHFAAREGHIEIVKLLLERKADINSISNNRNYSALFFALSHGHLEIVKLLIYKGANTEIKDIYGNNIFHYAAYKGIIDIIELLPDSNIINAKNDDGDNPLLFSLLKYRFEITELLLSKNADIFITNNKEISSDDKLINFFRSFDDSKRIKNIKNILEIKASNSKSLNFLNQLHNTIQDNLTKLPNFKESPGLFKYLIESCNLTKNDIKAEFFKAIKQKNVHLAENLLDYYNEIEASAEHKDDSLQLAMERFQQRIHLAKFFESKIPATRDKFIALDIDQTKKKVNIITQKNDGSKDKYLMKVNLKNSNLIDDRMHYEMSINYLKKNKIIQVTFNIDRNFLELRNEFIYELLAGSLYKRLRYDKSPKIDMLIRDKNDLDPNISDNNKSNPKLITSKFLHNFITLFDLLIEGLENNLKRTKFYNKNSEFLSHFFTLEEFISSSKNIKSKFYLEIDENGVSQKILEFCGIKFITKGFEQVFANLLFMGEVDFHMSNIGAVLIDGILYFVNLDFGRSFYNFYKNEQELRSKIYSAFYKETENKYSKSFTIYPKLGLKFSLDDLILAVNQVITITNEEIETILKKRFYILRKTGMHIVDLNRDCMAYDTLNHYPKNEKILFKGKNDNFFSDSEKKFYLKHYVKKTEELKQILCSKNPRQDLKDKITNIIKEIKTIDNKIDKLNKLINLERLDKNQISESLREYKSDKYFLKSCKSLYAKLLQSKNLKQDVEKKITFLEKKYLAIKQYAEAEDFFIKNLQGNLQVKKDIALTLEVIRKIDFGPDSKNIFASGEWFEKIKDFNPIFYAYSNNLKINEKHPLEFALELGNIRLFVEIFLKEEQETMTLELMITKVINLIPEANLGDNLFQIGPYNGPLESIVNQILPRFLKAIDNGDKDNIYLEFPAYEKQITFDAQSYIFANQQKSVFINLVRLVNEPNNEHLYDFSTSANLLYMSYIGLNPSLILAIPSIYHNIKEGEYKKVATEIVTNIAFMTLPYAISYSGTPFLTDIYTISMVIYSEVNMIFNLEKLHKELSREDNFQIFKETYFDIYQSGANLINDFNKIIEDNIIF